MAIAQNLPGNEARERELGTRGSAPLPTQLRQARNEIWLKLPFVPFALFWFVLVFFSLCKPSSALGLDGREVLLFPAEILLFPGPKPCPTENLRRCENQPSSAHSRGIEEQNAAPAGQTLPTGKL